MDAAAPQEKQQDRKLARDDARAEKPADNKKPAAPQATQTEAKAHAQDNKQVAGDKPEAKTEETVATDTAEDSVQTAAVETDTALVAQPEPPPAPQTSPSLLAALNGDTAQTPDAATQTLTVDTQIAAPAAPGVAPPIPGAANVLDEAQLAATTAAATQGATGAKPAAATEAKTPETGKAETQTADHKPETGIAAMAANDNIAPDASLPEAVPATAAEPPAKPAPQTANTTMAVHAPAPPQQTAANTPATTAQVAQHVEVSAAPKPNLTSLAVEISAKSQSGAKQFDIRLDPPELGRVEVRLSIDSTGKACAHLSADQPQTLDLLQKDASILTRALRDAGLDMAQGSLNFSLRQQAQGQQGGEQRGQARGARTLSLTATQSIEASSASATYRANGGVDIRV